MGYLAYAAGTLIVAVILHSLYNRKPEAKVLKVDSSLLSTTEEHDVASEHERVVSKPEASPIAPTISLNNGCDDLEHTTTKDQADDTSQEKEESAVKAEIPQKQEVANYGTVPRTSSPVLKVQSQDMPPPRLPPGASTAAQARQSAAMPPPSFLTTPRNRSPPRLTSATTSSLTPPARGPASRQGGFLKPTGFSNGSALAPPPSAASTARSAATLGVPQQKVLTNTRMQPALAPTTSTQPPNKRPSRKVILSPGHSPLDWAALTNSTSSDAPLKLRGRDATDILGLQKLGRITPSQLKKQTGRKGKDAWTSYQGRVYNISAYLDFHPGGGSELMKGAGRSSDGLFAEVHPWVNWDGMLSNCMIGMLVSEDDPGALGKNGEADNALDEMD